MAETRRIDCSRITWLMQDELDFIRGIGTWHGTANNPVDREAALLGYVSALTEWDDKQWTQAQLTELGETACECLADELWKKRAKDKLHNAPHAA